MERRLTEGGRARAVMSSLVVTQDDAGGGSTAAVGLARATP